MKKVLCILLALTVLFAFAACGKEDSANNVQTSAPDLSVDTVDPSENKIDFEVEPAASANEEETEESGGSSGNSIGFEIEMPTIAPVETYTAGSITIDFEPVEFDFDFEIVPFEVDMATIDFTPAEFKLENIENFADPDAARIDELTEDEMQAIVITKATLLHNLALAFQQAGLSVEINEVTGEIALDAAVLFGGDSAELTNEGKQFLQKFITVYSTVVLNEEFDGFISKVLVEGHTAPVAGETYESSLPLSEERAETVKAFCTDSVTGLSSAIISDLSNMLEPVGYSNTKPVLDADGNVDMAASRRVAFRFLINLD